MKRPVDNPKAITKDPPPEIFETPTILKNSLSELPLSLVETGLINAKTKQIYSYVPEHPLWSDGLHKDRIIAVPENTYIDTSLNEWRFPDGTVFLKHFWYKSPQGNRLVETRLIRKVQDEWKYAVYLWDDDQADATLQPANFSSTVQIDGLEQAQCKSHRIPNNTDCKTCHESSSSPILGFRTSQLTGSNKPWSEILRGENVNQQNSPPISETNISDSQPYDAVLSYIQGNCVHCHMKWTPKTGPVR